MSIKSKIVLFSILIVLAGCATYKPRPIQLVTMRVMNESYELTQDQLTTGKLAIIPCKNNTEHVEITSLLDSVLSNQLPEIFPEFIKIPDSFDYLVEQRNLNNEQLQIIDIHNFNIEENFIFLVEVDSIWNKNIEGSSFNYNETFNTNPTFNNPTLNNNPTWLITILELKLSIFDQEQAQIIWERKIQSGVSEVDNNLFIDLLNNKSDSNYKEICDQSIAPITVALSVLKLPVELQKELNKINISNDYNISIESALKLFRSMGANITKKKFDYKIEFNDRKIYLPLESKLFRSQNYNDIINLLKECNLYYKKLTKLEKGIVL